MKILHLTLKKKWFDMIASKEKPEEYRAITPYWIKRLCDAYPGNIGGDFMDEHSVTAYLFKRFDAVHFVNGGNFHPSHPNQTLACQGLEVREGRQEWGAEPGKKYFVIKLGERVEKQ